MPDRADRGKGVMALFAQGRDITTHSAKRGSSGFTAKAARNFLVDFDHADILFPLVVGELLRGILDKTQDLVRALEQDIQEIFGRMLLRFAALPGHRRRRWQCRKAVSKQRKVLALPGRALIVGQACAPTGVPFLGRCVPIQQQGASGKSPGLCVDFCHKGEIAQQMRFTPSMLTGKGVVTRPAIVQGLPLKAQPDADSLHGDLAALTVPAQRV